MMNIEYFGYLVVLVVTVIFLYWYINTTTRSKGLSGMIAKYIRIRLLKELDLIDLETRLLDAKVKLQIQEIEEILKKLED